MNVLVADALSPSAIEALTAFGCSVSSQPKLTAGELAEAVAGFNVLIVRSTRVGADVFETASDLALVVRAGAGVNTIDLEAADRAGVFVANCPGKNAHAVAELAIGLVIAADRGIAGATADLTHGRWRKKHYGKARGLYGRTIGILGYGTIGALVTDYASALGMNVLVWSRSLTPEKARLAGVERVSSPVELAERADVVSIHLASTPETQGLVNELFLMAMKEGAILVNTSRGDIVDQNALGQAISARSLKVALDVYAEEPGSGEAEWKPDEIDILSAATPHIGASTAQAAEAIAAEAAYIVRVFKDTGIPANAVNLNTPGPGRIVLVVRHRNRVGVLAGVLDALREQTINVEEMTNTVFQRGETASCSLRLPQAPDTATLESIRNQEHILAVRVEEIASE